MLSQTDILRHADRLRNGTPEQILAWSVDQFAGRIAVTVSFGGLGVVLAHMLAQIDTSVPVVFLDTGFLFNETYAFRDAFVKQYGLNVVELHPASDPGPLYQTDPDRCCAIRKVEPMERVLHDYDAWVSAVRRDQGGTRASTDVIELHELDDRPLVKVFPLAYWSREETWRYIHENQIPHHPLLDAGYASLGCWPCTRPTRAGESERAGRWAGTEKTECGLHTFSQTIRQ